MNSGELRVFHDTDLVHHKSAEVTSAGITNLALNAFLHYPLLAWGWASVQVAGKVAYCARMGRVSGIARGVFENPRCLLAQSPVSSPCLLENVDQLSDLSEDRSGLPQEGGSEGEGMSVSYSEELRV